MNVFEEDLDSIAGVIADLGFAKKTFFITGATGLVGAILVKALCRANEKYDLDNHVIAQLRNPDKGGRVFTGYTGMAYCVGDIRNPIRWDGAVDYIIHTASETKSKNMVEHPVETLWTTLSGSKNVLDFAKAKHAAKVVYLSSMEAFGSVDFDGRAAESMLGAIDLTKPRSCYPESKRMAENMCACYHAEYGVPVAIVRLAQTFGAGVPADDTRVFAQFARSAMQDEDIVLHTQGTSWGNYVYTADAAAAIFTVLKKGSDGQCYTVANESTSMKIRDMAQLVASEIANGKIHVVVDIPEGTNFGYAADTKLRLDASKMRGLGWMPQVGLAEMYRRMMKAWGKN
ncbi:MAG: NAD(P)-dependent oxidoreductase [Clostridia bacterium]|nr:NAD(P)-dependent oxidoreductase [Clostridia bacterium]